MGQLIYLKNVTTLAFELKKCVGCGMCTLVCPHAVFTLVNGKARVEHRDACMECGACALNCPAKAVRVDAGVGCAAAVINSALGRNNSACCVIDDKETCC